MSKSQKSNKYISVWRPTGKQYAEAEKGVYESKNVAVIVAIIFSLLANLLSVACFVVGGVDLGLAFVGAMVLCDVLFLILFSKANFCCQYSAGMVALYLVLNVLLTAASLLFGLSVIGDGSLFTVFGVILRGASVVVFTIVLLCSVHTARTSKHAVSFSVVLSVLLLGGLVYGQLFGGGYYGQEYSVLNGERTVVYALRTTEDGEEYYFAKDVLPGLGTKVVVADTYLDKEVRGVSVNVLTAPRLQAITLKGDRVMEIGGINEMVADAKLPNIIVERQLVEEYRQNAFTQGVERVRDTLAAAYMPVLEEGEVAVRFQYDTTELAPELYNAQNVLPVMILKAGERVEKADFTALMQNYYTQENVLEWSYENAYGWNLLGMMAGNEDLLETAITKNTDVQVSFERVKKVRFVLADAQYYVPSNFDEIGYISPSMAEVEMDYDHREGCVVSMSTLIDGVLEGEKVAFHDEASLRDVMFSDRFADTQSIQADVAWSMSTPNVTQFAVSAVSQLVADKYTYGDELTLSFLAENNGAIMSYALQETQGYGEAQILRGMEESETCFVGVRTPGVITFELTARADDVYGNKELFAETKEIIQIEIEKKTITGEWSFSALPAEYDGQPHVASYSIDATQAVTEHGAGAADLLTFWTTNAEVLHAGDYTFTATLDESLLNKYVLENHTSTYTLARRIVEVSWDATQYVYDANEHVPTASWTLADGSLYTTPGTNAQTNANVGGGKYTTVATVNDDNHIFASGTTTSTQYTILPKTLTMVDGDWQNLSFVFCNQSQKPTASVETGTADGLIELNVDNQNAINVGSYTATASISNINYTLEGVTTKGFAITKATAQVEWSNLSLTYNGNAQKPTATYLTFNTNGQQTVKATAQVAAVGESINVDTYTANASYASTLDEQNYTLENTESTFAITQKSVNATWANTTLTYNGAAQAPTATYKDVKNQTISLTVSGEQTDAGNSYSATAALGSSLEMQNYTLTNTSTTFKINAKSVAVQWSNTSVVYNMAEQKATATFKDVFGATKTMNVDKGLTDVGSTVVTATHVDPNYTFTNTSANFQVTAYTVTAIAWTGETSYVYNGEVQGPAATYQTLGGATVTAYTSDKVNAGSYTATATTNDKNYQFGGGAQVNKSFTIAKAQISVSWANTSFTYNGSAQAPTASATGVKGESVNVTVSGAQTNAGNNYSATASTNNSNYTLLNNTCSFTIAKKQITVAWTGDSFVADGKEKAPTATCQGVTITVSVTAQTGSALTGGKAVKAGSYEATASAGNNYEITNSTFQFTIVEAESEE